MTEAQQWQPPAGQPAPGSGDSPHLVVGGFVPPPPTRGWTPPPKPGLVPLRPLTLADILGASFQVLRRNPRPTFAIALAMQGAFTVITIVIVGLATYFSLSRLDSASAENVEEITAGTIGTIILAAVVPALLASVAAALLQGIIVLEVQRATLGEKQSLRQLWRRARGRLGALVGWTMLLSIVTVLAIALLVGAIVLFVSAMGTMGIVLAVLTGIFGVLTFVAAAIWLGTKFSLVPSVLMGERATLRGAIARSWALTGGHFWRTFGILLLVAVILGVVSQIVSAPFSLLAPMLSFILDPNGSGGPVAVVTLIAVNLLGLIIIVVFSAISMVIQSAVGALIYIDLRMRKEGLDLELARYVEQAQMGTTDAAADPYLRADRTFSSPLPPASDSA